MHIWTITELRDHESVVVACSFDKTTIENKLDELIEGERGNVFGLLFRYQLDRVKVIGEIPNGN